MLFAKYDAGIPTEVYVALDCLITQYSFSEYSRFGFVNFLRDSLIDFIGKLKADSHIACRAHVAPMPFPCHAVSLRFRMCLSHLIYTVRPCLIHTCYAAPLPFFSRPRHSMAVEKEPVD